MRQIQISVNALTLVTDVYGPARAGITSDMKSGVDLSNVLAAIERRLTAMPDDGADRAAVLRDRDRAALYRVAVDAGRGELIRDDLYDDLVARYS